MMLIIGCNGVNNNLITFYRELWIIIMKSVRILDISAQPSTELLIVNIVEPLQSKSM